MAASVSRHLGLLDEWIIIARPPRTHAPAYQISAQSTNARFS